VAPSRIAVVTSWHAAIGTSGSRHRLCTVTSDIDESMRTSTGGGIECVQHHYSLYAVMTRVLVRALTSMCRLQRGGGGGTGTAPEWFRALGLLS